MHAPVRIALDPERRGQHLQLSDEASRRRGHVDEARVAWSCPYRRDRARAAWREHGESRAGGEESEGDDAHG